MSNKKCEWKHSTGDDLDIWFTACDNVFEFTEDGIKENHFKYCPYCGGEILEKK